MAFNAGQLRHRVTLERLAYEQDSAGDPIQNPETGELRQEWKQVAIVWAACDPLSAREFVASQVEQSEVAVRFTIRYRSDVDASMRIIHRGKNHQIVGVLADRDSGLEYLTLPCKQGVAPDPDPVSEFALTTEDGEVLTTEGGEVITEEVP